MAVRTVWRFVTYAISHVAEAGVTWEIHCATYGCDESHVADRDDECAEWAMRHAAAKAGHDLFRRTCSDHARVAALA
jgi:hypothetical protein